MDTAIQRLNNRGLVWMASRQILEPQEDEACAGSWKRYMKGDHKQNSSIVNSLGRTILGPAQRVGLREMSAKGWKKGRDKGVLTIYMKKPENPVGKSNGSRHSVWESSENMDCDLRQCNSADLDSTLQWVALPPRHMFMHKISTRVVCVNGKNPRCPFYRGVR